MDESHMQNPEYIQVRSIIVDGKDRIGVSSVHFDKSEELIWMGNVGGHVTSYYGPDLHKYTSFQVHDTLHDVRFIDTNDTNVFIILSDLVRIHLKTGRCVLSLADPNLNDLLCSLSTGISTILLGGHQSQLSEYDYETGQCIRLLKEDQGGSCALMRRSNNYICCGNPNGQIYLRDPKNLSIVATFDAHSGSLSDFDIHGNQLVTCGFSSRHNALTIDRFLKVYDFRMNRSLAPIPVCLDPIFLRFVPTFSDRICVVSQSGQFQVIEQASTESLPFFHQISNEGSSVSVFDISSTYKHFVFGDQSGYLHLFASFKPEEQFAFNLNSIETSFAMPIDTSQPPYISITNELASFAYIPTELPPENCEFLSKWQNDRCEKMYRRMLPFDQELIRSIKSGQGINYATKPKHLKRNQIPYKIKNSTLNMENKGRTHATILAQDEESNIPKFYRLVEIKYSKLGVEDFDFKVYNQTKFAGLESSTPNSHWNVLLQNLYFIEPYRKAILNHLCSKEHCLTCEMAFLFHMLDKQDGNTCQPTNFLRTFRASQEAVAMDIVLVTDDSSVNMCRLIQSSHRFCLRHVHSELLSAVKEEHLIDDFNRRPSIDQQLELLKHGDSKNNLEHGIGDYENSQETSMTKLFGTTLLHKLNCLRCDVEKKEEHCSFIIDLSYPNCIVDEKEVEYTFSSILKSSFQISTTSAWCINCNRYQPHKQKRIPKKLGDVLAINCRLENKNDLAFWEIQQRILKNKTKSNEEFKITNKPICRYGVGCTRRDCKFRHDERQNKQSSKLGEEETWPSWIPFKIKILITDDELLIKETDDNDSQESNDWITYELHSTIAYIDDSKKKGHLVAHINIGSSFHVRKEQCMSSRWYLFNDFAITPIDKRVATSFSSPWKIPCIIYYTRKDLNHLHNFPLKNPITKNVLLQNTPLVNLDSKPFVNFVPLEEDELPLTNNDIIGLDAEFVTLYQEEAEFRSDGTKATIKPSHMSVGRVSCVRGDEMKFKYNDEPFIDDYISTREEVVDYLTQFSGIQPGDLNVASSNKHLTTLKSTYTKLRYLVDAGVQFVGHGLKKDFRVINIIVPKEQVIDTVELFYLPKQRMISLKFLAWFFLGINIQSSVHDSIEDARTALKLYKKYMEISKDGPEKVKEIVKQMYEKGRSMQWRIPDQYDDAVSTTNVFNSAIYADL